MSLTVMNRQYIPADHWLGDRLWDTFVPMLSSALERQRQRDENKKQNAMRGEVLKRLGELSQGGQAAPLPEPEGYNSNPWAQAAHQNGSPLAQFDAGTADLLPPSTQRKAPNMQDIYNIYGQVASDPRFSMVSPDWIDKATQAHMNVAEAQRMNDLRSGYVNDLRNAGTWDDRVNILTQANLDGATNVDTLNTVSDYAKYRQPNYQPYTQNRGGSTGYGSFNPATGEWTQYGEYGNTLTPQEQQTAQQWDRTFDEGTRRWNIEREDKRTDADRDYEIKKLGTPDTAGFTSIEKTRLTELTTRREALITQQKNYTAALAKATTDDDARTIKASLEDITKQIKAIDDEIDSLYRSKGNPQSSRMSASTDLWEAPDPNDPITSDLGAHMTGNAHGGAKGISSPFNAIRTRKDGSTRTHKGVDYLTPKGTEILVPDVGTALRVKRVGNQPDGYGNYAVLSGTLNGHRIEITVAHMQDGVNVKEGDIVRAGDLIGLSGNTGNSTGKNGGYHLHLETKIDGEHVDPTQFRKTIQPYILQSSQDNDRASKAFVTPNNTIITVNDFNELVRQAEAGKLPNAPNVRTREDVINWLIGQGCRPFENIKEATQQGNNTQANDQQALATGNNGTGNNIAQAQNAILLDNTNSWSNTGLPESIQKAAQNSGYQPFTYPGGLLTWADGDIPQQLQEQPVQQSPAPALITNQQEAQPIDRPLMPVPLIEPQIANNEQKTESTAQEQPPINNAGVPYAWYNPVTNVGYTQEQYEEMVRLAENGQNGILRTRQDVDDHFTNILGLERVGANTKDVGLLPINTNENTTRTPLSHIVSGEMSASLTPMGMTGGGVRYTDIPYTDGNPFPDRLTDAEWQSGVERAKELRDIQRITSMMSFTPNNDLAYRYPSNPLPNKISSEEWRKAWQEAGFERSRQQWIDAERWATNPFPDKISPEEWNRAWRGYENKNNLIPLGGSIDDSFLLSNTNASYNLSSSAPAPKYADIIDGAAQKYGIDNELIQAIIEVESTGDKNAKSNKGAMGLMQLMPGTARSLGVRDAYDPAQNIDGGSKYIAQLIKQFGSVEKALMAYNGGPSRVKRGKIPKAARAYAKKVMGIYNRLKGQRQPAPKPQTAPALQQQKAPDGSNISWVNSANQPMMSASGEPFTDDLYNQWAEMIDAGEYRDVGLNTRADLDRWLADKGMRKVKPSIDRGLVRLNNANTVNLPADVYDADIAPELPNPQTSPASFPAPSFTDELNGTRPQDLQGMLDDLNGIAYGENPGWSAAFHNRFGSPSFVR